jgi:hypothetical protein
MLERERHYGKPEPAIKKETVMVARSGSDDEHKKEFTPFSPSLS